MKTKHFILYASLLMLLTSCALESKFGQVKETHLSGCNTGTDNAPARWGEKTLSESETDTLEHYCYVRVKELEDGSYFILAQYQVNCCPESVDANLYVSGSNELQFNFEERGIGMCDCICPLRCDATLVGMEEGEYPVNIYYNGELQFSTTVTLSHGVDEITLLNTAFFTRKVIEPK